jgi:lysophospholipase L1-like esterase
MTDTAIPRAMSRIPLPPTPPPGADIIAWVEAGLEKQPIDPELQAKYTSPEAIAAREADAARRRADDWAALSRYRAANAGVRQPDLVMIGDSLTEIWGLALPDMFGERIVNRGISGQTSQQILLRFMADVVDLKPKRVHILCGGNDIAGNNGPNLPEDYQRNVRAMIDLALANGIDVLLASLTPAASVFWSPDARPLEWIPLLNDWLRDLAIERKIDFIDYHAALDDGNGGLQERYSADGVHVTREAYRVMHALLEQAMS